MNDIAAIKARREAVTPEQLRELRFMANCHNQAPLWGEFNRKAIADVLVERDTLLAEVERLTGERDALTARFATQNAALAAAVAVRERALARCAAAPADIDTLLAEVERLDRVLTGQREYWFNEYRKAEAERDALATGREIQAALIDTLTTQRDALAAQLQQAQGVAAYLRADVLAAPTAPGKTLPATELIERLQSEGDA